MIIHSLPDEHASEFIAREQGSSSQQKTKWLYELERAQWKQQPLSKPHSQPPQQSSDTESENALRDDKTSHVICSGESNLEDSNHARQVNHTIRNSPPPQLNTSYIPIAGNFSNDPVAATTFAPAAHLQLGVTVPAARIASMTTELGTLAVYRSWEKQHAHMQETDTQISLWLRDARINENQGIQLAFALRKRFAELGKHLAQFTLNGKSLQLETRSVQSNPPT